MKLYEMTLATRKEPKLLALAAILAVLGGLLIWFARPGRIFTPAAPPRFNGERALRDVHSQVAFGPRTPGSAAQAQFLEWSRSELAAAGWQSQVQVGEKMGHTIRNLVAYRDPNLPPRILLGAHYDSRLSADQDPDPAKRVQAVPGANDGASGVAVLLELARVLPADAPVWLVFFDAEDNGRLPGWDWLLGSRTFVEQMTFRPQAMILVDMVGDADLRLPLEQNSDPTLQAEIWSQAEALGYGEFFVPEKGYRMLDDHLPFIEAGIPAVDIIDFDYPYWHTTADTADKVSASSLQAVGETLQAWLMSKFGTPEE
jgi:glutaminyl-peptide cyclotransferase